MQKNRMFKVKKGLPIKTEVEKFLEYLRTQLKIKVFVELTLGRFMFAREEKERNKS